MAAFKSALDKLANQYRKVFLIRGSQVRILPGVLPVLWLALSVICLSFDKFRMVSKVEP